MKKFFSICKKVGKILLIALTVGFSLMIAVKIRKAIRGIVKKEERTNFRNVPGDSGKIRIIKDDGSTEVVGLPEGIKYKDIKAVGVSETNKVTVEVLHAKTDRRNLGPVRDDNALDAVRSRVRPDDETGSNPVDGNPIV